MSQGAAGSDFAFLYADREGKLTDLGGRIATPCRVPGTLRGWVSTSRAPARVCQVPWWWLCSDR